MRLRTITSLLLGTLIWFASWAIAPDAQALIDIALSDLHTTDCPAEFAENQITSTGTPQPGTCYLIVGKAKNPSFKPAYDVDIFGRIYDATGNPVLQNRTRLGSLDEVPPGTSDFELRITVATIQPAPLQLKQFKARGFPNPVGLKFD